MAIFDHQEKQLEGAKDKARRVLEALLEKAAAQSLGKEVAKLEKIA